MLRVQQNSTGQPWHEAGLDLPILWPAMGVDSAREVIAAFRQ
jgi:hypothetical protein